MPEDPPRSRAPLRRASRTLVAALLVGGVVVSYVSMRELFEVAVGRGLLADYGRITVPMAATAWLAPHASYRRRDALWWFLPPAGLYLFAVVAWRVAFLPYRDWAPRPDEASRVHWLSDRQGARLWHLRGDAQ